MEYLNIFLSGEFWSVVYIISKWIFIVLSLFLFAASVFLLRKISKFRQKLNIKEAATQYQRQPQTKDAPQNAYSSLQETNIKENAKSKWKEITAKIESENEKDWRLAALYADALLDEVLKKKGAPGETLKERLNSIKNQNTINLNEVWEAHKIRNEIAHNSDFVLSKSVAERAIKNYKRALTDLKVL